MTDNPNTDTSVREAHAEFEESVDTIREKNGADDIDWESGDGWQRVALFYGDVPESASSTSIELSQDDDGIWHADDRENHRVAAANTRHNALRKLSDKLKDDYMDERFGDGAE